MQFTELMNVSPEIIRATQAMGLTDMTEIQEKAIPLMLAGHGMIAKAPTGKAGCQIVVATPGRLMDHYRHHAIDVSDVKTVVLDEADEMLNMGFYKDVKYIIDQMKHRESLSLALRHN